jgi:hypothetical protein
LDERDKYYDDRADARATIALCPLAMAGAAAFPIFMGIFVRMTMLEFLKENRDEKARRFFGLFFFVSLKVFTFKFDIRKVIPSFIGKRLPAPGSWLPKIGKKKSATVAVEGGEAVPEGGTPPEGEVAAEGAAEGAAAAEGDIEAPAATADNSEDATADAEDEEESEDSDADVSSEEEFEVAENEVAWNCRVCNEFNLQEKIVQSKNMTKRRLGTKENAANVKMVVRTVGRIHEHYVVEFKQLKNTNHCRKCWTAHDYKPQHCNAHSFFGLQDYKDQLHEPAAHVEGVNANTFEGDYGTCERSEHEKRPSAARRERSERTKKVPVCGGSGSSGGAPRTPPAAGEVACSASHMLGRTCARPHMCSAARAPHAAHMLGRT